MISTWFGSAIDLQSAKFSALVTSLQRKATSFVVASMFVASRQPRLASSPSPPTSAPSVSNRMQASGFFGGKSARTALPLGDVMEIFQSRRELREGEKRVSPEIYQARIRSYQFPLAHSLCKAAPKSTGSEKLKPPADNRGELRKTQISIEKLITKFELMSAPKAKHLEAPRRENITTTRRLIEQTAREFE
jgi:hypothetical protein